MKTMRLAFILIITTLLISCNQDEVIRPDLNQITDGEIWTTFNRTANVEEGVVHLDARPGSGLIRLNDLIIGDGIIELDIKGKDMQGQSFVGLAFHGLNDSVYDAVYLRPFNFLNEERNTHSVQYIAHPKYTWFYLRENHPGKYENKLVDVTDPNDWFHVKIEIGDHLVKAYVDGSDTPSLEVSQISHRHEGWLGFWVGHGSEGWFRNLEIHPAETESVH